MQQITTRFHKNIGFVIWGCTEDFKEKKFASYFLMFQNSEIICEPLLVKDLVPQSAHVNI